MSDCSQNFKKCIAQLEAELQAVRQQTQASTSENRLQFGAGISRTT